VKSTVVENSTEVRIVPRDGHGHEYQFVVTAAGTIENFMFSVSPFL